MNGESESSIKKYRRLGKNTILIFIGNIGSKLINLVLLPFYTQWLSPEEYGKTELIITYSTIVFWIVSCSIFDSVFVFPKEQSEEKKKEYFTSALLFGVVSVLLCSAVSSVVYSIGINAGWKGFIFENIWQIFGIMSLMYVQTLVQEFVRAIDKFAVYSITGIVQAGVITVFSFFLIPHYGVRGFVLGLIAIATAFSLLGISDLIMDSVVDYLPRYYSAYVGGEFDTSIEGFKRITKFLFVPFYILAVLFCSKRELTPKDSFLFSIGIIAYPCRLFFLDNLILARIGYYFLLLSILPLYVYMKYLYMYNKGRMWCYCMAAVFLLFYFLKTVLFAEGEYDYHSIYF